MSGLTVRSHGPSLSLESYTNDRESLYNQLDRINKVIQTITSEQLSPGLSRNTESISEDSYIGCSKFSYYEEEEEDYNPELYNECSLIDLTRSLMIKEDYRSHEFRNHAKYSTDIDTDRSVALQLCVNDLIKASNEIDRIKLEYEIGVTQNSLKIGEKKLKIFLKDREVVYANKKTIQNSFGRLLSTEETNFNLCTSNFATDLEAFMKTAYNESIRPQNTYECPYITFTSQADQQKIAYQKSESQKLLEKLEWQCAEISMIKEQYHKKLSKLNEQEKILIEKKNETKNEENKLKTQQIIISKDVEIIQQQKKNIQQIIEDNRKKSEIVKNVLAEVKKNANFIVKPLNCPKKLLEKKKSDESIVLKPRRNEVKYESDIEIQSIQKEIQSLEVLLKNDTKNSESIQTKIDRLKTKQSNLKSKRVITASLERSNSVTSKINFFEREKSLHAITSSPSQRILDPSTLLSSNKINIINSKKPPIKSFCPYDKPIESPDEFQKYLKLREARLLEKEDELSKRETMMLSKFSRTPDSIGLIPILQNEQRNLKILRNDLEKRQKNLEQEVLSYARKCTETKAKEREVLTAIESFDVFLYQKKHLEERLQFLLSVFEDISSTCIQNINNL
jgi:hypothetical protein